MYSLLVFPARHSQKTALKQEEKIKLLLRCCHIQVALVATCVWQSLNQGSCHVFVFPCRCRSSPGLPPFSFPAAVVCSCFCCCCFRCGDVGLAHKVLKPAPVAFQLRLARVFLFVLLRPCSPFSRLLFVPFVPPRSHIISNSTPTSQLRPATSRHNSGDTLATVVFCSCFAILLLFFS